MRFNDLGKIFKQQGHEVHALVGASSTVWPGETLGLVGESGSGKTTLGRALLGIVEPTTGTVELDGRVLAPSFAKRNRRRLASASDRFSEPGFRAQPTPCGAQDPAPLAAQARRCVRRRGRAAARRPCANRVRVTERTLSQKPVQLSGGLKQRVAIARAFAGDPRLVVCDEPTSALDVSVQAAILNLLVELQAEKRVSYLFISHDLGVVRYISDRIAVLYLGRLQELGPAEVVFDGPTTRTPRRCCRRCRRSTEAGATGSASKATSRAPRLPRPAASSTRAARGSRLDLRRAGAAARRGRGRPPDALPHPDRGASRAPASGALWLKPESAPDTPSK